jgi:Holliday junction resolvasome RuvABC endonuclease subunit
MKILALDLATNTGVAIGNAHEKPLCSSERLGEAGDLHGARFLQAQYMLSRLIKKHHPDLIAIEAAIAGGVQGGQERVQLAMGLRACVMSVAHMHKTKVEEYAVQTVRKHFIGNAKLRRDAAKTATINRCQQVGWRVANDNEADAAAVWDYARTKRLKISTPPPESLFDHAKYDPSGDTRG